MTTIDIPIPALPMWLVAVSFASAATVTAVYLRTQWHATAAVLLRTSLACGLFWTLASSLLGAPTEAAAAVLDRFYLPFAYLALVGVIEMQVHFMGMARPRWLAPAWILGLAATAVFAVPATAAWFPMQRNPDGFWMLSDHANVLLEAARVLVYGGALVIMMYLIVHQVHGSLVRRVAAYVGAGVATVPFFFNDAVWAPHHRTPYPTIWMIGVLILGAMTWELRRHVVAVHESLNTDAATGAASRGYGELYGAERLLEGPVGVVFGDMDDFKAINDRYGHTVGDSVLREVVARLRSACGPRDRVVRLGGDELLVVFPDLSQEDGPAAVARVAAAVAGEQGPPGYPQPHMSLGWAWAPRGASFGGLVERADGAMYVQKRRKRDPAAAQTPT